jgi:P-type conjugative transfer protein TrbJ
MGVTLALAIVAGCNRSAHAQWAVFDVQNYAQNVLQAARALQQINNQITALQNQATMLTNMATNLRSLNSTSLNGTLPSLTQIGTLMNQGQGISFNVSATQSAYARYFPQQYAAATTDNQLVMDAQARWQDAQSSFGQSLNVQAQVAQNVQADGITLSTLISQSQGAVGNLQALQAVAQLLALSIKQQLQIETLLAAQGRSTTLDQAANAESDAEAQAAYTRFLGTSTAYSPQ